MLAAVLRNTGDNDLEVTDTIQVNIWVQMTL